MGTRVLSLRSSAFALTHPPASNIACLDILRSLAILLVFSSHFADEFNAVQFAKMPPVYFGWTGVDLFFVLSGYLIGTQIWQEVKRTRTVNIGRFLLRRGLRIWPLYYSFTLLVLVEGIWGHRSVSGLWADATFLSNYFHHQVGGGWSLATEEQFYVCFPLLIALFSKFVSMRKMVWIPIVSLLLLPFSRAVTILHFHGRPMDVIHDRMFEPIHTHADGLAVGVLVAWISVSRPGLFKCLKYRMLISLASVALAALLYLASKDLFDYSSLALIFGAMTILAIGAVPAWPQWISHCFYAMSRLSFGIYLNHFGILPIMSTAFGRWQRSNSLVLTVSYLLCLLVCLVFAAITFALIEQPWLKLRHRVLSK